MSKNVAAIDAWATLVLPGTIDRWPPEFISIFKRYGSLELFATEACTKIVERALHYNGAAGFMTDSPIQRYYKNCKVFELSKGSSELQRNMIAWEIGL